MTADDTLDDVTAGGLLVITFFLAEAPVKLGFIILSIIGVLRISE
jgi:hypothetical protein